MNKKAVEAVTKMSIFWTGNRFVDRADLEEQALFGAGNVKTVTAEVDLSASDREAAVTKAVEEVYCRQAFRTEGPGAIHCQLPPRRLVPGS